MENIRPWYRWHVNRWRNSPRVLSMSLAAQGAYRNLLDAAWNNGGKLPNNPDVLWRFALAGSQAEFSKIASQIMPMFRISEDSKWLLNETLTSEWDDATEWFEKKSKAGKKGAGARWSNGDAMAVPCDCHDSAIAVPMAKHGTTQHNTTQHKELKPSAQKPRGPKPNSGMAKASGQTRHERLHQIITGWYRDWAGAECPWDGGEGAQLAALLKSTPDWLDQQFVTCLDNLARSDCVAKGDRPREWLARLPKFLNAPLDKFKNPKGVGNGSGNSKAAVRDARNLAAVISTAMGPEVRRVHVPDGETVPDRADSRAQRPDDPR